MATKGRHLAVTLGAQVSNRCCPAGPARTIERRHCLAFGIPVKGITIAADARGNRLRHIEHGRRGNRRIGCIAPGLQDIQPGLCGQWLAGRHHPAPGHHIAPP